MTKAHIECDWNNCNDMATHTVEIRFPDRPDEIWCVCRAHDRLLKTTAVRNRAHAPESAGSPPVVECSKCGYSLRVDSEECPSCGSRDRVVAVSETIASHESSVATGKASKKGKWLFKLKAGDDYTHDLEAWGTREFLTDRSNDRYREDILLYDGTRIISTARLSDHHD